MKINEEKLKSLLKKNYGILVKTLTPLNGFYDKNYKITTASANYFIKIYGFDKLPSIKFQLDFLSKCFKYGLPVAKVIQTNSKTSYFKIDKTYGILQEFLGGEQLRNIKINHSVVTDIGFILGSIHKLSHRSNFIGKKWKRYQWDLAQFNIVVKDYYKIKNIIPSWISDLIDEVIIEWKSNKIKLAKLRKGSIHNDFQGRNILVAKDGKISIVDFGDAINSWYIADIAISLAHICFTVKQPSIFIKSFLRGYQKQFKLLKLEKDFLPLLMKMRAVTAIVEIQLLKGKKGIFHPPDNQLVNLLKYFKDTKAKNIF